MLMEVRGRKSGCPDGRSCHRMVRFDSSRCEVVLHGLSLGGEASHNRLQCVGHLEKLRVDSGGGRRRMVMLELVRESKQFHHS